MGTRQGAPPAKTPVPLSAARRAQRVNYGVEEVTSSIFLKECIRTSSLIEKVNDELVFYFILFQLIL